MTDERIVAFGDALRSGDVNAAISKFDGFDEALDQLSEREREIRDIARKILTRSSSGQSANDTAQKFLKEVTTAQQARIEAKQDFLLYLKGGPSGDAVAEKVDAVISANQSVQDTIAELRDRAEGFGIGAVLQIAGPDIKTAPKGESIALEYTVANIGVESASGLTVSTEGPVSDVSPSIERVDPGSEKLLTVELYSPPEGESSVRLIIGDSTANTRILVRDATAYLDRFRPEFDETKSEIDEVAGLSRSSDDDDDDDDTQDTFADGGIDAEISADIEEGVLSIVSDIEQSEDVEIDTDVEADEGATREQVVAGHLAVSEVLVGLAEQALNHDNAPLTELLQAISSELSNARNALLAVDGSEDDDDESRKTSLGDRQLAIFADDLRVLAGLADTASEAKR